MDILVSKPNTSNTVHTHIHNKTKINSDMKRTDYTEAERRCNTTFTQIRSGPPVVFRLHRSAGEYVNTSHKIRKFEIGTPSIDKAPSEKVLLMVGATGAGKSTLINSIVNHIYGVEFSDKIRFELVDETKEKSQAQSQTSVITSYAIHHHDSLKVPYTLTIIDTPGFGDTQGIARDAEIMHDIKELFISKSGIDHIDAVCFLTQASLARLTTTQRYIFDSIMSLFGKDIKENIMMMLTFADGQTPNVLEALAAADLPTEKNRYFKFNNSPLYANNTTKVRTLFNKQESHFQDDDDDDDEAITLNEMFWNVNKSSFARFFTEVKHMVTKSLQLTRDVLKERAQLEIAIEGIQESLKHGLAKIEELDAECKALKKHEKDIGLNRNFSFKINSYEKCEVPVGRFKAVNCEYCKLTCHDGCKVPADILKWSCEVFKKGQCQVCYCKELHHKVSNNKYVIKNVTVVKTLDDLKKKYEAAFDACLSKEKLVNSIKAEIANIEEHVLFQVTVMRNSLKRLGDIALIPNPLSTIDYLNKVIQKEKDEEKPGWNERVEALERIKHQAKELEKLKDENYNPFKPVYEKFLSVEKSYNVKFENTQDNEPAFKKPNPDDVKEWITMAHAIKTFLES